MSKTTVTVTNNNTTVYINSVNASMASLGLTQVPAGTPVPQATQQAMTQMTAALVAKWPSTFSSVTLPASNTDSGYMGPWTANVGGTAPSCVVQQIGLDFGNWGLPTGTTVPTDMAEEITEEIAAKGGSAGFASGTKQLTGSEYLYWMVAYATVNITQSEQGILYVFAAQSGINLPTALASGSHHFAPERQVKAQARQALAAASAAGSSITIISEFGVSLVLTYGISSAGINVGLELDTPVGDISLGNVTLNASNPSASLGGSIDGFEAKVTVSFNVSAKTLTISGDIKVPIFGSKSFSKTIQL